ncbi:B-cell receptor-associated protein 31 [Gossypium australe]|uniref:Endoplasmic reticulum transmembrane protein n=1 Tax=Gossypium australe TaxID=47621 RepID=A0A5B6VEJ8_9ROSI|nr:B-cell receptor-associated protein 31 [Gossypium australe]
MHLFLSLLLLSEMTLLFALVFSYSKLRELITKMLDKIVEGKGGAISLPVVATLTVVFISMVYDAKGIWTEDVVLNAADEVLMVNLVLKATLMGFALYLALLTYGFHKYIKGSRPWEAAKEKKSI